MTRRPVRAQPVPTPSTTGQWWFAGLAVTFAVGVCLTTGFPSDGPSRSALDRPSSGYSAPPVSSGYHQSENHNYPNFNGPNVRSGAGKALRRALR